MKIILAFFVLFAHCPVSYIEWTEPLARLLCPLFLMVSGFFLTDSKGNISSERLRHSLRSALVYLLGISALYTIFLCYHFHDVGTPERMSCFRSLRFWGEWLLFGHSIHHNLWYLTAWPWAILIVATLRRLRLLRLLPWLAVAGALAGMAYGKYWTLFFSEEPDWILSVNFWAVGLPCITAGIFARRIPETADMRRRMWRILPAVTALYIAEAVTVRLWIVDDYRMGYLYLMSLPLCVIIFFLFATSRRFDNLRNPAILSTRARDIYFYQSILIYFLAKLPLAGIRIWDDLSPLTVFILIYTASAIVSLAARQCRLKFSQHNDLRKSRIQSGPYDSRLGHGNAVRSDRL